MSDEFRIGVVGAGATGGYLAGRLSDANIPVTLFVRGRSLEAIRKNGIRIDGPDDYSVVVTPEHVVSADDKADIECTIDPEILTAKWQKFLFNCALNPLTALTRERLGPLLETEEGSSLFESLINEAIAVGKASGAPLCNDAYARVMETARQMNISSSMAEDLDRGRPIELDAFSGYIRQLGQQTGIPTPTTDVIYRLLLVVNPGRKAHA